VDHVDVFPELAAEPSRHPGGVKSGDSVRAVADGDPCQSTSSRRARASNNAPQGRKCAW
jgi:hypothetical protein